MSREVQIVDSKSWVELEGCLRFLGASPVALTGSASCKVARLFRMCLHDIGQGDDVSMDKAEKPSAHALNDTVPYNSEVGVPEQWNVGDVILATYGVPACLGSGGFGTVRLKQSH